LYVLSTLELRCRSRRTAESNMEIFMESRRRPNIRNSALFGNFSFYFSFSAEKELLLIVRLFFGRKIFFTFGGFTFSAENGKIIFGRPLLNYNIRRHYFTGCTHYALVTNNIRLWNCSFQQTCFLFTKIAYNA